MNERKGQIYQIWRGKYLEAKLNYVVKKMFLEEKLDTGPMKFLFL